MTTGIPLARRVPRSKHAFSPGKYVLAAASTFVMAGAVHAQDARPALAGGDLVGGIRTPGYRTDVSVLGRGRVVDGFRFAAGGDLLGPYNPLSQLGDPVVN